MNDPCNELPPSFDFANFAGKDLNHIMFTRHSVSLCFDAGLSITTVHAYTARLPSGESETQSKVFPIRESMLSSMIGEAIETVSIDESSSLTIHFANGADFICHWAQKNSYQIAVHNGVYDDVYSV